MRETLPLVDASGPMANGDDVSIVTAFDLVRVEVPGQFPDRCAAKLALHRPDTCMTEILDNTTVAVIPFLAELVEPLAN
jgi:hypothetical protein